MVRMLWSELSWILGRFAHDIVMDDHDPERAPRRLMLLGSAGTGKSRTVRAFVGSKRRAVRERLDGYVVRAAAVGGVGEECVRSHSETAPYMVMTRFDA